MGNTRWNERKPCPFCGSMKLIMDAGDVGDHGPNDGLQIVCKRCGAMGPVVWHCNDPLWWWNTRRWSSTCVSDVMDPAEKREVDRIHRKINDTRRRNETGRLQRAVAGLCRLGCSVENVAKVARISEQSVRQYCHLEHVQPQSTYRLRRELACVTNPPGSTEPRTS